MIPHARPVRKAALLKIGQAGARIDGRLQNGYNDENTTQ
jgi:hypothetical protein